MIDDWRFIGDQIQRLVLFPDHVSGIIQKFLSIN